MPRLIRLVLVTATLIAGAASAFAQGQTGYPLDPNTTPGPFATRPTAPPIPIPLPDVPPVPRTGIRMPPPPERAVTMPKPRQINMPTTVTTAPTQPTPPSATPTELPTSLTPPPLNSVYVPPPPTERSLAFEPYWNNGLYFRTADRGFVTHIGGVLQYDAAWYSGGHGVQTLPGGVGRFQDGATPRRLRLMLDGTWYDSFDYKLEVEFANGFYPAGLTVPASTANVSNSLGPLDAYVTVKNIPWLGNVRIGNQKEWFSLEHQESARMLMFMERSYLFDASQPSAFNNGRSPGISTFRTWANDSLFTAIGFYKNESNTLGIGLGDGDYAVTGRVGALPIWLPEAQTYWYAGGAMSYRDPVNGQAQVRVRNSVRNAPLPLLNLIANTGLINADHQTLLNLQSAFASGPLTVSGEVTSNLIAVNGMGGPSPGTLAYNGFYLQGSYFLTGEHREWDPKVGVFKRVTPHCKFDPRTGSWGGWEVGARVQHLDLDDRGVNGGRLSGVTLGLTWYWAANMRVQMNYDYLYRDGGPNPDVRGSIHSLGTRLAIDF